MNRLNLIIDAAKNDDMERVIQLATEMQDKFCDNNCVWTDHHPDCVRAEPEWYHVIDVHGCNRFYHKTEDCSYESKTPLYLRQAIVKEQTHKVFSKVFALMRSTDDPCTEVMAVGQLMKEWLEAVVADAGTVIDTGKGFSEYDLWVQCEGKELFITIKEKKPTK